MRTAIIIGALIIGEAICTATKRGWLVDDNLKSAVLFVVIVYAVADFIEWLKRIG